MQKNLSRNKTKVIAVLITFVTLFSMFFECHTANAAVQKIDVNGSSIDVSVSGFKGTTANGGYIIDDKIAFNFGATKKKQFNKFSICYSSSDVLKGVFTYKTADYTLSEEFFLEKGEALTFTSMVETTIEKDGKEILGCFGINPLQIVLEPIRENETVLCNISSLETSVAQSKFEDVIYIENDHFKLGVYLAWGGGVNYIEDKLDGDDTVTNMINYHDTGRLVQQSYYGTTTPPYVCGKYNGTTWGYNPVQGGNLYGEKSKLIDFKIDDDYIYVKSRPRDWAKLGEYSFAYMENKYILHDDYIEVENRFIDFSTYNHGETNRHQELPAFYTISYLDTFTFYGGTKSWTDDTLTEKKNLPFWGDSTNTDQCYIDIDKSNTETWCSWTSSETGHGIGVFTPQTEMMLAGMFKADGSKNPKGDSVNYVAPIIKTTMRNFEPFSYTYLIATGDVSTIRSTFKEHKDGIDWKENIDYTHIDFETINDLKALTKATSCKAIFADEGIVKITSVGDDSKVTGAVTINTSLQAAHSESILASDYKYFVYTYMVPKSNSAKNYSTRVYFRQGNEIYYTEEKSIKIDLVCDGNYHTEIINLNEYRDVLTISGDAADINLKDMKLVYFEESAPNDNIYISCIALAKDEATATNYGNDALKTDPASFDPSMMKYTPASDSDRVAQLEVKENQEITEVIPSPTPTPSTTGNSEQSNTNWALILTIIGIGVVVVCAIVTLIIVKSLKKIKKAEDESQEDNT